MPIDPSLILAAGKAIPPLSAPDPLEQYSKSLALRHLLQQGELTDIQTQSARDALTEQQGVRSVFKNAQPGSTFESLLPEIYKVSPKTGLDYQAKALEAEKARTGIAKDKAEIVVKAVAQHRDQLAGVNDPQAAAQWVASGYADPALKDVLSNVQPLEQAIASIPTDPAGFQQWKQQHALGATKFIELNKPQITTQNLGGTERVLATPGLGGTPTVLNETARTATPDAIMTDARTRAEGAANRGVTMRGQNMTDQRARELNGIMEGQGPTDLTPTATAIANHDIPLPNPPSGSRNPMAMVRYNDLLKKVKEINPEYNAQDYPASKSALQAFSTGKQGNSVRSFNVALSHLDTLGQLADALKNKDTQAINRIGNFFAEQTGQAAPTNFDAAKKIVGDEIVKAIVGSGGGVADREEAARTIASKNSPEQLKGVIATYKELMKGQLGGLRKQYEETTHRKDFDRYLSEEAKVTAHGATPAAPITAARVDSLSQADPAKYKGQVATGDDGSKYRSDGSRWVRVP